MRLEKRDDGWWICDIEDDLWYEADGDIHDSWGPYSTKAEAESEWRGVQRTMKGYEI